MTIDTTPEVKMPVSRYFHASDINLSKQSIFIYGGLNFNSKNKSVEILRDFWQFSIQNQRWSEVEVTNDSETPVPLAGHTLTFIKDSSEKESLLLIGGYSNITNLESSNGIWEYNLLSKKWTKLTTTGASAVGIFGHSTVYHQQTQMLYIFGGYQLIHGKTRISNKLHSFHFSKMTWNEVPVFLDLNSPEDFLPRARFLHSAISTENYMLVYGGQTYPHSSSDVLNAYVYKCNAWIRLTEDAEIVGKFPAPTYAQGIKKSFSRPTFLNLLFIKF